MCECVPLWAETQAFLLTCKLREERGGNREGGRPRRDVYTTFNSILYLQIHTYPDGRVSCDVLHSGIHVSTQYGQIKCERVCSSDAHNVYAICKAIFVILFFLSLYFIAASRCTTADLNLAYQNVVLVLCKQEICIHDSWYTYTYVLYYYYYCCYYFY